jgi:hypothetical protein
LRGLLKTRRIASFARSAVAIPEAAMTDVEPDRSIASELASRLGQIVMRWSAVEGCLSHLLATLVNADPVALSVMTDSMTKATQAQSIRALLYVQLHNEAGIGELLDHLTKADDLRADRNALVHGLWDATGCQSGACQVHSFKSGRFTSWLVTTAELDELIGHINKWTAEFIALGQRFGFPRRRGEARSIFNDLARPNGA